MCAVARGKYIGPFYQNQNAQSINNTRHFRLAPRHEFISSNKVVAKFLGRYCSSHGTYTVVYTCHKQRYSGTVGTRGKMAAVFGDRSLLIKRLPPSALL